MMQSFVPTPWYQWNWNTNTPSEWMSHVGFIPAVILLQMAWWRHGGGSVICELLVVPNILLSLDCVSCVVWAVMCFILVPSSSHWIHWLPLAPVLPQQELVQALCQFKAWETLPSSWTALIQTEAWLFSFTLKLKSSNFNVGKRQEKKQLFFNAVVSSEIYGFFDEGGHSISLPVVLPYFWSHFYARLSFLFPHLDAKGKIMALMMIVALPFSFRTSVKGSRVSFRLTKCHSLQ